ncbi:MAG TPA: AmmeMemoRadiSam system protein B [Thermoanaerobaculia bacterium]|nr:AmmeMemoRadiSam system protein B [Thermoanaerobaculia bacterium]
MHVRAPAVAGSFYEGSASGLRSQLDRCLAASEPVSEKESFVAAVVPHAGLMYSGAVAGALYGRLALPRRFVIVCPNHTGEGAAAAIDLEGAWRTPLGEAPVDAELAAAIRTEAPFVEDDRAAHAREHSLEVQLPFLQLLVPEFRFVPLCVALRSFERVSELGRAIARAIARAEEPIAILASSDLNHYESQPVTLRKDMAAIDRILALDAAGLWETVRREEISMCGIVPTTAMLVAANELGATSATLVRHATSGDVNGDYGAVVGYAAIAVR